MACAPVFPPSLRRRRSPLVPGNGFFSPADLTGPALVRALSSLAADISSSSPPSFLQRRNSLSLLRRARGLLSSLLEPLRDSSVELLPPPTSLCLRELYILLYRSKSLLDYLSSSSRLWLLLHSPRLSFLFHDLSLESSTLLDLLPIQHLPLPPDAREHLLLLQSHSRSSRLYLDPAEEALRLQLHSFLHDLRSCRLPDSDSLHRVFVSGLGIRDVRSCRSEIEFLEDQIYGGTDDDLLDPSVFDTCIALLRYSRFLLFGFTPDHPPSKISVVNGRIPSFKNKESPDESFITIPKEYCCPISLDLMRDPVIVATGQTYERSSIVRWMDEGHNTCPNSGQTLFHKRLIPNRALRSIVALWCFSFGISYDPPETLDALEAAVPAPMSQMAKFTNCATADLLINQLRIGTEEEKTVAARELRLLAKTGRENRVYIADAGAIPLLERLLSSNNAVAQENAVTAILNLSIQDKNKSKVMEVDGCLNSIVRVLRFGLTTEARENAAATLFSLSAVHDYKKLIGDEEGALEALAGLLISGTPRGRRDAVTALYNLATHPDCSGRLVNSGAAEALVNALAIEGVVEEAAGALGLLARRPGAANSLARDGKTIDALVVLMRQGGPRGKENAVAALAEMCKSGGASAMELVAGVPSIGGIVQTLLFTGTKRARRKASSLARSLQKYAMAMGGMAIGFPSDFNISRSSSMRRMNFSSGGGDASQGGGGSSSESGNSEVAVSLPVSISVPVL